MATSPQGLASDLRCGADEITLPISVDVTRHHNLSSNFGFTAKSPRPVAGIVEARAGPARSLRRPHARPAARAMTVAAEHSRSAVIDASAAAHHRGRRTSPVAQD